MDDRRSLHPHSFTPRNVQSRTVQHPSVMSRKKRQELILEEEDSQEELRIEPPRSNAFAAFTEEDPMLDTNDPEEGVPSETFSPSEAPTSVVSSEKGSTKSKSKSKKKTKKKDPSPSITVDPEPQDDDLDVLFHQLKLRHPKDTSKPEWKETDVDELFKIQRKHLDYDAELRRCFGAGVVNANEQRSHSSLALKKLMGKYVLVQAKSHWLRLPTPDLAMQGEIDGGKSFPAYNTVSKPYTE